jgi:hypothetical protein
MGSDNKESRQERKRKRLSNSTAYTPFDPTLVYTLIGTFFGFILFAVYDALKDYKTGQREKHQVLSLLAAEATDNLYRISQVRRTLTIESDVTKSGSFVATSPTSLSSEGWTIAKSRNVVELLGGNIQLWLEAYTSIGYVNNTLAGREIFKHTNRALYRKSEFMASLKTLDDIIVGILDDAKQRIEKALQSLPKEVKPPKD